MARLNAQLAEKDKEIAAYKHQFQDSQESSVREHQLILSAFYEVSLLSSPPLSSRLSPLPSTLPSLPSPVCD